MTPLRLTALAAPGTVAALPAGQPNSPLMISIATLWIPFTIVAAIGQVARNAMQRQLTGPLGTWGATNIRFLFGFPFSIVFFAVVLIATGDHVPWPAAAFWPWLLLGALSQIVGHRADAACDERPLLRGDDGVSEDRGDPDRDLRLCLSRRSSDGAEGGRDPDRDRRRGHHRAAARRREEIRRPEADDDRPRSRRRHLHCRRSAFAARSSPCRACRS